MLSSGRSCDHRYDDVHGTDPSGSAEQVPVGFVGVGRLKGRDDMDRGVHKERDDK